MIRFFLALVISSIFIGCSDDVVVLTEEEQRAFDIELIDQYLSDNDINAEIHESGIRFVRDEVGTGASPSSISSVVVKYKGAFLNGQTFDSNDIGVNFDLQRLILAWQLMIPEMKEGGKITIYAPSFYCYGARGNAGIPPNTVLVFEIELLSLVRSFEDQLAIDLEKIDDYLAGEGISPMIHSSEIRYQTINEGDGLNPNLNDVISVNYKASFLSGELFDEGSSVQIRLNNTINSWKTMVPIMKEGGKMIIYAPSGFCYGNTGFNEVPPNANLIFEIELLSVN